MYLLKIPFTVHFINISLTYMLVLIFINLYSLGKLVIELRRCSESTSPWWTNCIISQLSFTGVIVVLLVTLLILLHRSLGAIPRIEGILAKVIEGDYSLRITVRNKDTIMPFVAKLNKLIELLDKNSKK
jgi:signal transduction histidine kinase